MKWFIKNAFWIVGFICWCMMGVSVVKDQVITTILFGSITLICVIFGIYYMNKPEEIKPISDKYVKAHYIQGRKNTFKILKGGKQ